VPSVEPVPAPAEEKHDADAPARPAAVLTFGGEEVPLPFVEHAEEQHPKPALTLDRLAEAFAHLGQPASSVEDAPAKAADTLKAPEPAAPGQETVGGAATRATVEAPPEKDYSDHTLEQSRQRRPRRHRAASRAQGAANETAVQHHENVQSTGTGHSHAAKAPDTAKAPDSAKPQPAAAAEPIILGVGVPASEL
jgi:ribonuclease E